MLKTKILAGPITNLTDARYFAAWEVEWLQFNIEPESADFIEPRAMGAIREWVDGVKIVGEFNLAEAYEIREAIEKWQLDAVRLGMLTPIETMVNLQATVPVFKEIVVERTTTAAEVEVDLETWQSLVQVFVLNFTKNNITWAMLNDGNPLSVDFLNQICNNFPIMLAIDLQPEMLNNMLKVLHLSGLCVKGGVEEKTGYKSFDELDAIFESLTT